jgi:hypothetical protein
MSQTDAKLPRGFRNNNPGNIRHSGIAWEGQSAQQPDPGFVTFADPEHGIRALARIILNYQSRYGLATTEAIIGRWAPPSENNTAAYVQAVANAVGVPANSPLSLRENLPMLRTFVAAIIAQENGSPRAAGRTEWYDAATVDRAIALAVSASPAHPADRSFHHHHHPVHHHHPTHHHAAAKHK